ncbi:MAG: hypothetical protein TE42_09775 [Candidatus Synechococcus spongiarum SP3]|uniref:Uncharacterized protein n=1 Tax=Candidatus Synechococcus spongiarum SP3 TaxID=1604020 RepID=A0A0G2HJ71_9SYNE|nr:MAG: hypothetical protein TE42_09775 [Candidatus Synechococcus spongiarum SP3]
MNSLLDKVKVRNRKIEEIQTEMNSLLNEIKDWDEERLTKMNDSLNEVKKLDEEILRKINELRNQIISYTISFAVAIGFLIAVAIGALIASGFFICICKILKK